MYSCETIWVKVLVSGCSQKLQYKHYNEKKQTEGEGGRVNDTEFSGVKLKVDSCKKVTFWKVFLSSSMRNSKSCSVGVFSFLNMFQRSIFCHGIS